MLGALLLGETSLLLQLLVAEQDEEALDTTKPGDRQPLREEGNRWDSEERKRCKVCVMFVLFHWKPTRSSLTTVRSSSSFPLSHGWKYLKPCKEKKTTEVSTSFLCLLCVFMSSAVWSNL